MFEGLSTLPGIGEAAEKIERVGKPSDTIDIVYQETATVLTLFPSTSCLIRFQDRPPTTNSTERSCDTLGLVDFLCQGTVGQPR